MKIVLLKYGFYVIRYLVQFYVGFIQILHDSDRARRELILHKKACENCPYIVKILDIYVRILVKFGNLLCNEIISYISGEYA